MSDRFIEPLAQAADAVIPGSGQAIEAASAMAETAGGDRLGNPAHLPGVGEILEAAVDAPGRAGAAPPELLGDLFTVESDVEYGSTTGAQPTPPEMLADLLHQEGAMLSAGADPLARRGGPDVPASLSDVLPGDGSRSVGSATMDGADTGLTDELASSMRAAPGDGTGADTGLTEADAGLTPEYPDAEPQRAREQLPYGPVPDAPNDRTDDAASDVEQRRPGH